jgi:hypothetical protein
MSKQPTDLPKARLWEFLGMFLDGSAAKLSGDAIRQRAAKMGLTNIGSLGDMFYLTFQNGTQQEKYSLTFNPVPLETVMPDAKKPEARRRKPQAPVNLMDIDPATVDDPRVRLRVILAQWNLDEEVDETEAYAYADRLIARLEDAGLSISLTTAEV